MDYRIAFDITTTGYPGWEFSAYGLVFVVIGISLIAFKKNLFAFCFLGFAVIWTITTFVATYGNYSSLSSAAQSGRVEVVEGVVTDFKPMPKTGHTTERFCVSNKCFAYSDYIVTGGFNNTSSHGGPIREGLPVRISHVDGLIIKLEIAR